MASAGLSEVDYAKRRRRSALLSLIAAIVTAGVLVWAAILSPWEIRWLLGVGWAPVALSIAAWVQYRWKTHSGAGAAAAVVYWVLIGLLLFEAIDALFIGAILQTWAWWISRPSQVRRVATPEMQSSEG